jgi:hypothetical protein
MAPLGHARKRYEKIQFTLSIVDRWTSFVRTHDPKFGPEYLRFRGFTNRTAEIEANDIWKPVDAVDSTMRYLQWPSRQQPLGRDVQWAAMGLSVDYYLE